MTARPSTMLSHQTSVLLKVIALVYITGPILGDASTETAPASRKSYSHLWDHLSVPFNRGAPLGSSCAEVPVHVLSKINLTLEQLSLLPSICWHDGLAEAGLEVLGELGKRSGIPAGVQCTQTQW